MKWFLTEINVSFCAKIPMLLIYAFMIALLVCFNLRAQTDSEISDYQNAVNIINMNNASEQQMLSAKNILASLAMEYGDEKRFCTRMGDRKMVKGPGGVKQWVEAECEEWASIRPQSQLTLIDQRLKKLTLEKEQIKLAEEARVKAAQKIEADAIAMTMSFEEGYKDGVLDSLESLKINLGFKIESQKKLENAVIEVLSEPVNYFEAEQQKVVSIENAGNLVLNGRVARAAKAGPLSLKVSVRADNLGAALTKSIVLRVRN